MDVHLFVSERHDWRKAAAAGQPAWVASDVALAESGFKREFDYVYRPSKASQGGLSESEAGRQEARLTHRAQLVRGQPIRALWAQAGEG